MMLTLDSPIVFTLFALCSILVSLAAVPVAFTRAQAPQPIATSKIRLGHLFKQSPVGIVGCFAVGLANGAFWSLAPVFANSDGGGEVRIAAFMSFAVIAGAIGQWPLGRISDRTDRRKVIIAACIGAAIAGIILVIVAHWYGQGVFMAAFLFGFFAFPLYALCVAHMNDFVDPEGYVEAAGGLLLVFAIGAVIGPIMASTITNFVGIKMLFVWTALVHILTAIFAAYRMTQRAPAPAEEHIAFSDALVVAQTVSNVDPKQSSFVAEEPNEKGDSH
jgi:MFS family permease